MADELMHELVAAYALDALDPDEEREFEAHLTRCPGCREELAELSATGAALAHAAPPAEPPAALRERILAAVRAERPNVVPLRPRWAYPALAAAAAATCAAIGLGTWAATMHSGAPQATALRALSLRGAAGSVVVAGDGEAALVVAGLPPAPAGKTYEAWVILGRATRPAGLFAARAATTRVQLTRRVPRGATVGVTLEPAGGSPQPTRTPLFVSAPA